MPVRSMGSILARSNLFSYLAAATPGLQEMVTMGKIWEVAHVERRRKLDERVYDLVIVDSPATGHGITLPAHPGRVRVAGPGRAALEPGRPDRPDALRSRQLRNRRRLPARGDGRERGDPAPAISRGGRRRVGFAIDRHYVNGVRPDRFSGDEMATIGGSADDGGGVAVAARAALSESATAASQGEQIRRLEAEASAPVTEMPFLYDPEVGPDQLAALADEVR